MTITITDILRVILYFVMFGTSFYCLSGVDFSKLFLNQPNKAFKAQMLLIILSLALGFLSTQFILAIMFKV